MCAAPTRATRSPWRSRPASRRSRPAPYSTPIVCAEMPIRSSSCFVLCLHDLRCAYLLSYDTLALTCLAVMLLASGKLNSLGQTLAKLCYWLPAHPDRFGPIPYSRPGSDSGGFCALRADAVERSPLPGSRRGASRFRAGNAAALTQARPAEFLRRQGRQYLKPILKLAADDGRRTIIAGAHVDDKSILKFIPARRRPVTVPGDGIGNAIAA